MDIDGGAQAEDAGEIEEENVGVAQGEVDVKTVEVVTRILGILQEAAVEVEEAMALTTDGVGQIGTVPAVAVEITRVVNAIRQCQATIQASLGDLQNANAEIAGTMQQPQPQPQPLDQRLRLPILRIAEAHDLINATAVALHNFVLVLVKAQLHGGAQAQLQLGLVHFHLGLGQVQFGLSLHRNLFGGRV
uniref:uncharacterized protein LOC105352275 n=1 Tax=Fragaria vesca subsp. vesca TaxID=101020 RepID=UPI0005CA1F2F|nr:PREDICTED: uncharacterized protein LOC105352275 [Fragaria vesca subsp. vesca]